uniref:Uncharacterized protein n=1 Tax=Meloidogyne incognita TaxID=6306 RepID=A0A914NIS6_MELIC
MARTRRWAHDILKFKELPNDSFSLIRVPLFGFPGPSSSIGSNLDRRFQKPLWRLSMASTSTAGVEIIFSGVISRSSLSTTFFFSMILCRIASAETSLFTSLPLTSTNTSPGKMFCAAILPDSTDATTILAPWN